MMGLPSNGWTLTWRKMRSTQAPTFVFRKRCSRLTAEMTPEGSRTRATLLEPWGSDSSLGHLEAADFACANFA